MALWSRLGRELLPWQANALEVALELRADGSRWRYSDVGVIASRQNGKTTVAEARILAGLYVFGDRILHTAQNLALPTQSFRELAEIVESTPWLASRSKIRRVNAAESIEVEYPLPDGRRYSAAYYVVAPSPRRARGHKGISLVVIDELREQHDRELYDAITPTTTTRRPGAQIWHMSNAGGAESVILNELRERGTVELDDPSSSLAWLEFSADPELPIDSPSAWIQGNPSLGARLPSGRELISWDGLRDLYRRADPDAFRTEHLCQWLEGVSAAAVPIDAWLSCTADSELEVAAGSVVSVGVELDPDRRGGAVAVAHRTEAGRILVGLELLSDGYTGAPELAEAIAAVGARYRIASIGFDPSTGSELAPLLPSSPFAPLAAREWLEASRVFVDAVMTRSLVHPGGAELEAQIRAAGRRSWGDGSWTITRRDSTRPIPAVLALIRAVYGASRPTPRPFIY